MKSEDCRVRMDSRCFIFVVQIRDSFDGIYIFLSFQKLRYIVRFFKAKRQSRVRGRNDQKTDISLTFSIFREKEKLHVALWRMSKNFLFEQDSLQDFDRTHDS